MGSYEEIGRALRAGRAKVALVVPPHWGADLVAMGRHGHSAVSTLLMGSVAQKVLATAHVPVRLCVTEPQALPGLQLVYVQEPVPPVQAPKSEVCQL